MTAEIDTFIKDVSTTRTNIAAASRSMSRRLPEPTGSIPSPGPVLMSTSRLMMLRPTRHQPDAGHQPHRDAGGGPVAPAGQPLGPEFIEANGVVVARTTLTLHEAFLAPLSAGSARPHICRRGRVRSARDARQVSRHRVPRVSKHVNVLIREVWLPSRVRRTSHCSP